MILYKITNNVNQKVYVGITVRTLENRWIRHMSSARRGSNSPIHRAMRKHGFDSFTIEPILEATSVDELKRLEQQFIQALDTFGSNGYNATRGGDGTMGRKHSTATLEKIKQGLKKARDEGRFLNEEWYAKCLEARKCQVGKPLSDEHKQKISDALKGKPKLHISGKRPVSVDQFSLTGEYIKRHASYGDAAREVGSNSSDIMRCCQGKQKTVKGYTFEFATENETEDEA
jgi:group I intron endonuclease